MAAPELLETAIEELRRTYDELSKDYDQVRIKILTFLGGGLALLSFLYAAGDLFIPIELYGRIFYFTGLALTISALVILFYSLKPVQWLIPVDFKEIEKFEARKTKKDDYLVHLKEEYVTTLRKNMGKYQFKQNLLNISSNQLIIGAIILLVLKFFNGG